MTPTDTPAGYHDTVLLPARPVSVTIPVGATEVTKRITVKVRNADIVPTKEAGGHTIRLAVSPGDCPALTVDGKPDFSLRTPGDQDTVLLTGGKTKGARLRLKVAAADYLTGKHLAPTRCTLLLTASTELAGNQDPTPHNNVQALELNVLDRTDAESAAVHESLISSARPVQLSIRRGAPAASRTVSLTVVNADKPEVSGHAIAVSVNAAAGDCPPGVVSVLAPSTRSVKGGGRATVRVALNVTRDQFASANRQSPDRCTAVLEAATDVLGNVEPDPSNNTTRLLIGVDDKADY